MTINLADLKLRLADIIGDQQGQYDTIIALEIDNTIRRMTKRHRFYWNTVFAEDLPHTNGVITLPSVPIAQIHSVFDNSADTTNNSSLNYFEYPQELFYIAKKYPNTPELSGVNEYEHPFIIDRDSSGNETLVLHNGSTISSSLTFNIVYSEEFLTLTDRVPDRLYTYILAETAFILLADLETEDVGLMRHYQNIARSELMEEMNLGKNKAYNKYNNKVVPPSQVVSARNTGI